MPGAAGRQTEAVAGLFRGMVIVDSLLETCLEVHRSWIRFSQP
jgi:hypothetical protein